MSQDQNAVGGLTFFDASGNPITSGPTDTAPFAAYVEGRAYTRTVTWTDTKASLLAYVPVTGQTPDVWSTSTNIGGATIFPNSAAPAPVNGVMLPVYSSRSTDKSWEGGLSAANFAAGYTGGALSNVYEVRLYTNAPGHVLSVGYDYADISVDTTTHQWSLVYTPDAPNPPPAMAAPSAVAGQGQATVSWTAPTVPDGDPAVWGYDVQYSSDGGTTWHETSDETGNVAGNPHVVSSPTSTVMGLTNGTSYVFRVAAMTPAGTGSYSSASSAVTPMATAPAAPTGVTATSGNANATVQWTAPSDNGGSAITGFSVKYSTDGTTYTSAVGSPFGASATSAVVTGLANGTPYYFEVAAINTVGTGSYTATTSTVTPVAPTVPGVPTGVSATRGNSSATVNWTTPVSNGGSAITGFSVKYSTDGTTYTSAVGSPFGASATSAVVTGLANGTPYYFEVAAINTVGTGSYTATTSTVTPAAVPGVPTAVSGTAGSGSVALSWTAPASNGSSITEYQVQYSTNNGNTWSNGPTSPMASATVTGLSNGVSYLFRVVATNGVGPGSPSTASSPVTLFGLPGAPAGVSGTAGNGSVTLSWVAAGSNGSAITGYQVQYSSNGGTTWTNGPTSGTTGTTVTGLANGTAYIFRVGATNAAGTTYSAASAALTPQADASGLSVGKAVAINDGRGVVISTTLTDTKTGAALAGQSVQLLAEAGTAKTFTVLTMLTTSGTGTASVSVKPTQNTTYEWSFAGTASNAAVTSGTEKVTVAQVVTIFAKKTTVKHKTTYKIYGLVAPSGSGTVALQRQSGKRWVSAGTARLVKQKLPNGQTTIGYLFSVAVPKKGKLVYRVVRSATSVNGPGTSSNVSI